ncbi:hypothetical protein SETIT_9G530000v2 [Setaria italica]|uniref:Pectin acetylesterase n=1 Tax=Setaria italica TaxID=4555 RepID=K4AL22_SETIT|nr:hypothetical protein SETIT_9G530000v2 [Setaria italica]
MARAAVVAVLLMQCCNVILAARPLLGLGGAGTKLILQVLDKGSPSHPCQNGHWQGPGHPSCT